MNTNIKDIEIEDIYNFLSIDFKNEEGITKYSQVHYYKTPPDDEDLLCEPVAELSRHQAQDQPVPERQKGDKKKGPE